MLLGTHQRLHNSNVEIILDGEVLQMYECTSYLGVDLMNNLSWSQYIVKLCSKLAQKNRHSQTYQTQSSAVVIGYFVSYNYTATL